MIPAKTEMRGKLLDLDYVHGLIEKALWMIDRLAVSEDLNEEQKEYFERRHREIAHELTRAHVEWCNFRYRGIP